ncbi:MAG: hypothetical protein ABIP54_05165 [Candidatus Andersenbacteria bacterium]
MQSVFTVAKNHKLFILACIGIALILAVPLPVIIQEASVDPGDTYDYRAYDGHDIQFNIPSHTFPISNLSIFTINHPHRDASEIIQLKTGAQKNVILSTSNILELNNETRFKISLPPSRMSTSATIITKNVSEKKPFFIRVDSLNHDEVAQEFRSNTPLIVALLNRLHAQSLTNADIQYVWSEGRSITKGINPYKKAEHSSYNSSKYATYFPLSYIVSAGIQKLGFSSFESWITIIRPLEYALHFITAFSVLFFLYRKKQLLLGFIGFFLILFDRWSLYVDRVAHIDFAAMAFLVIGLTTLKRFPKTAYLLIGTSLAIKQMAIFIIPIILIWVWNTYKSKKQILISLILISVIPIITITPFFITSPLGVANSIFFSATRGATGDLSSPAFSTMLDLQGLQSRVGMGLLILLVCIAFYKKRIGLFGSILCTFIIFTGFSPVLYMQYLAWITPFIPLAIYENGDKSFHRIKTS